MFETSKLQCLVSPYNIALILLPLNQRRSIRSITSALEIPKSTLFTRMKRDMHDVIIMPKSLALKPMVLIEMHKRQRVLFAASKLNPAIDNHFHPVFDSVHAC